MVRFLLIRFTRRCIPVPTAVVNGCKFLSRPGAPSTGAPYEQGGDDVIPDHTHDRAAEAGDPPGLTVAEQPVADADIRQRPDQRDDVETQEPDPYRAPGQPLVAIGEGIAEGEIAGDCQDRGERLSPGQG